jgi:hypothetical protein
VDLPFLLVDEGPDTVPVLAGVDDEHGLIGFDLVREKILSFGPDNVLGTVSIDPAACFYGVELRWEKAFARPLAAEASVIPRYAPRGYKFQPLPKNLVSGFPATQLRRHRRELPSLETIRLSTIFAGSTIMVSIEKAEESFACIADLFVKRGQRFAPLSQILDCIHGLGLHRIRSGLYRESEAWAASVQAAIATGKRDRELRKYLFLESRLPIGISLAKLSFTLALLGHDCVCLDARILGRMFGKKQDAVLQSWKGRTELALKRYERTEDAFLKGNRLYNPKDPIGRARAQWMSWESVGGKPAKHSVWLDVVS